jgi:hypothetical protein
MDQHDLTLTATSLQRSATDGTHVWLLERGVPVAMHTLDGHPYDQLHAWPALTMPERFDAVVLSVATVLPASDALGGTPAHTSIAAVAATRQGVTTTVPRSAHAAGDSSDATMPPDLLLNLARRCVDLPAQPTSTLRTVLFDWWTHLLADAVRTDAPVSVLQRIAGMRPDRLLAAVGGYDPSLAAPVALDDPALADPHPLGMRMLARGRLGWLAGAHAEVVDAGMLPGAHTSPRSAISLPHAAWLGAALTGEQLRWYDRGRWQTQLQALADNSRVAGPVVDGALTTVARSW